MNNKTLGILIFTLSIFSMIGYFCWLFIVPKDVVVLGKPLDEWALIVPVVIIVYAFLLIVAWTGWALASTPPPLPITKRDSNGEETEREE